MTILYLCQPTFSRKFNSQFPMVIMFLLGSSKTLANKQKLKWTVYARGNLSTSFFFPTEENQINKFGLDVRLMTMLDYVWNVYFYWVTRCISMSCQEEFICHYLCVLWQTKSILIQIQWILCVYMSHAVQYFAFSSISFFNIACHIQLIWHQIFSTKTNAKWTFDI